MGSDQELIKCKLANEFLARDEGEIDAGAWELISQACQANAQRRPTMMVVIKWLQLISGKQPQQFRTPTANQRIED